MGARSASTRGERRGDGPSRWRPRTDRTYHEVGIGYDAQDEMPLIEEEYLAIDSENFHKNYPLNLVIYPENVFQKTEFPFLAAQNKS